MFNLLRLLFSKRGFKCRVVPPGAVYASKCGSRQLVLVIDLDELDNA